jgi:hypothetical protein
MQRFGAQPRGPTAPGSVLQVAKIDGDEAPFKLVRRIKPEQLKLGSDSPPHFSSSRREIRGAVLDIFTAARGRPNPTG